MKMGCICYRKIFVNIFNIYFKLINNYYYIKNYKFNLFLKIVDYN